MPESQRETLTLPELRERIVAVAASEPAAFEACVTRLVLTAAGRRCLKALEETLGSEYSRRLAPAVHPEDWAAVAGQAPVDRPLPELRELYRALLWERMGEEPRREDPFSFLQQLGEERLARMLEAQAASSIALISAFWSPARMGALLDRLPASRRVSAIQEIVLLERMPAEAARAAALAFADRLESESCRALPPPFRHAEAIAEAGKAAEASAPHVPPALAEAIERIHESRAREREIADFLSREAAAIAEAPVPVNPRYAELQAEIDREISRLEADSGAVLSETSGSA